MGEVATGGGWVGGWHDSRLRDANMSSSSDRVDAVTETMAASTFASRSETMLSLDARTSENIVSSPSRGPMASRSSWIKRGLADDMVE